MFRRRVISGGRWLEQTVGMEGIMRGFFRHCARNALGLGAAAFFLTGISAQAGAGQPLQLAQSATQQEKAAQLEKQRQQEEQKKALKQKDLQMDRQDGKRMRGPMPRSAVPAPVPEAVPPQPGSKRFGAGVVRHGDDPGDSGQME
jgi:hypothetical protein